MSESIIRSEALTVEAGLEIVDPDTEAVIEDISDDLLGGSIRRDNYATIHGTAFLQIARPLSWQINRLRPYITLIDQTTGDSVRWDLGVYLPETPARMVGETPVVYEVEAYDRSIVLDTPYGSSYRVASGAGYISTVEGILDTLGLPHGINQEGSSKTLPSDRIWELDEKHTTLRIINDLLQSIGYRGLYVDRSGVFRSEPWESPKTRSTVFHYDTGRSDSIVLGEGLVSEVDLFDIPNVWVFVLDNPDPALPVPTEGSGIYTVTNQSDGITSIDARGRIKRAIHRLDAADQASLVARGNRIVEEDKQPETRLTLTSGPNPTHWHANVVRVTSNELGLSGSRFAEVSWELPLDGSPMTHELRKA